MDEDVASRKRTRSVSPTTAIGPTTERPQKRRRRGRVKDEEDENVLAHPRGPLSRVRRRGRGNGRGRLLGTLLVLLVLVLWILMNGKV